MHSALLCSPPPRWARMLSKPACLQLHGALIRPPERPLDCLLPLMQESLMELEPAKALQETVIGEHEAVFEFLFTVADEILTPLQEAYLDREAYPWWPDIWVICNLLARRCNLPPVICLRLLAWHATCC